jgi:hypothetical protein
VPRCTTANSANNVRPQLRFTTKARLNLITAGTTTFRYLAYAGAAGGILGIITDPAESVALFMAAAPETLQLS